MAPHMVVVNHAMVVAHDWRVVMAVERLSSRGKGDKNGDGAQAQQDGLHGFPHLRPRIRARG